MRTRIPAGQEGVFILNKGEHYKISSMGRVADPTKDAVLDNPDFIQNVLISKQSEFDEKTLYRVKNDHDAGIIIETYSA